MIDNVRIYGSDLAVTIYIVTYRSGRTVTMLKREAPATVRKFLNLYSATRRTLQIPMWDGNNVTYSYYDIVG